MPDEPNAFERIGRKHDALSDKDKQRMREDVDEQTRVIGLRSLGTIVGDGGLYWVQSTARNAKGPADGRDCFNTLCKWCGAFQADCECPGRIG